MLILLVGLAFLILSFSSYALAFQINGINRSIVSTPISIFEASATYDINGDKPNIMVSKKILKEKLDTYYSFNLSKFVDEYSYEIYFYNKEDNSMCIVEKCNAVEITFSASLMYSFQYHRVLTFEVFNNTYGS